MVGLALQQGVSARASAVAAAMSSSTSCTRERRDFDFVEVQPCSGVLGGAFQVGDGGDAVIEGGDDLLVVRVFAGLVGKEGAQGGVGALFRGVIPEGAGKSVEV